MLRACYGRVSVKSAKANHLIYRHASTTTNSTSVQAARAHCLNILRKHDVPSYLMKGYISQQSQDAFIALNAFNVDVALVADSTSHAAVGSMRMQFWRDGVDKALAGTPPSEPVAVLLAHVAEDLYNRTQGKHRLSRSWLHRIINTREQYLGNRSFPNLAALESYAENTYSTLLYLILSTAPLQSLTTDHLASHVGKATGIVAVLRGLPLVAFPPQAPTHHTSNAIGGPIDSAPHGAVLLPLDVMAETGLQEEDVLRHGPQASNLKDAIFTVATRANDHLITAREMLKNLTKGMDVGHDFEHANQDEHLHYQQEPPALEKQLRDVRTGFGALLPAVTTSLWLEQLEKLDFDVFDKSLMSTNWKVPWRLFWSFNKQNL